nr:unnamed protein product [Callosobruchus chinensis]
MPRGNGQVERANRTVIDGLATMGASTTADNWDSNLTALQQGINSSKHKITDATPATLLFGTTLRMDGDRYVASDTDTLDITALRQTAYEKMENNRQRQDDRFNSKRKPSTGFKIGDLVLTKIASIPSNSDSKKLVESFKGPFKVIEVLPNDRYKVKEDIHATRSRIPYEAVVCLEHMKPFKIRH